MNRRNFAKFVPVVGLLLAVGFAGQARADDDGNKVSLGFMFNADLTGRFSMVGGGEAIGTAEVTSFVTYNDAHGNLRAKLTKLIHFAGGDVTMSTDGTLVPSATNAESVGTWTLTGGTGLYAGVKGSGDYIWNQVFATGITVGAYSGKLKLRELHGH